MKKIAVLHAQIPFSHGGAEFMAENLTKELNKRGFWAELVCIPFRLYPENGLYDNLLMWRMLDLTEVNGETIDLVIPTKFPTYGIRHPKKVIWLMHQHRAAYDLYFQKNHYGLGTVEHGSEMKKRIQKFDDLCLRESDRIYTISENVSRRLSDYNGISSEKLYHPPALYGNYYCSQYEKYVLSVGRLDPLKRTDLMIQALNECDPAIRLYIAGTGPEEENLKRTAEQEGVADRVEFLGYVSEERLLELYANAGCVYYAPVDEDYGYVTLEAFLSKKPVITCEDSGGVLEFVRNEQNGIVCACHSQAIGQAVSKLFQNHTTCKEYGQAGYDLAKEISWEHVVEKLTEGI